MSDWREFQIEEVDGVQVGVCDSCASPLKTIGGRVSGGYAYFVSWSCCSASMSILFFVMGQEKPRSVALLLSKDGSVSVTDEESTAVYVGLRRDEIIGTQLAGEIFAVSDAVLMKDSRLADLRSQLGVPESFDGLDG